MEEKQLETAVDTNTTTSRLTSNRAAAADGYDSDTVIDPANEHRDDPANCNTTRADSGSKSKGRRTPNKKHSSSKKATGTNADLNYRDLGGDDEDRHREAIVLR